MSKRIIFKDSIVQYPNKYKLTDLGDGYYELEFSPGTVNQAGTPLSAANMNAMADEIIFKLKDTSTSQTAYTADLDSLTAYYEGLTILFKPASTNVDACTININSVGAVPIKKTDNSGNIVALTANDLIKNKYSTMTYDGTEFIMSNPSADLAELITDIQDIETRLNTDETTLNALKNAGVWFATTIGSANAYTVSLSQVTSLYAGLSINLLINLSNTGASTLQVNSLTAKPVLFNGSALTGGELQPNKIYNVIYDGVQWNLQPSASQMADNTNKITTLNSQMLTKPTTTTADVTYYVNVSTGNDNNNGLNSSTPFKTISKAISLLPQVINHTINIKIASGTYPESVSVSGFIGKGSLAIDSMDTNNYSINYFAIVNCSCVVTMRKVTITTASAMVMYCSCVTIDTFIYTVSNNYGIEIYWSNCSIVNSIISNKTSAAIIAALNSKLTSATNGGTGNLFGLVAQSNATIGKNGTQPSGTTAESASSGGAIR